MTFTTDYPSLTEILISVKMKEEVDFNYLSNRRPSRNNPEGEKPKQRLKLHKIEVSSPNSIFYFLEIYADTK
jgi:hypothetical protein